MMGKADSEATELYRLLLHFIFQVFTSFLHSLGASFVQKSYLLPWEKEKF